MMKKLIIGITIFFYSFTNDDYCSEYSRGFVEGYAYSSQYAIAPVAPPCPVPFVGRTSEIDGYNRGFADGVRSYNNNKLNADEDE